MQQETKIVGRKEDEEQQENSPLLFSSTTSSSTTTEEDEREITEEEEITKEKKENEGKEAEKDEENEEEEEVEKKKQEKEEKEEEPEEEPEESIQKWSKALLKLGFGRSRQERAEAEIACWKLQQAFQRCPNPRRTKLIVLWNILKEKKEENYWLWGKKPMPEQLEKELLKSGVPKLTKKLRGKPKVFRTKSLKN